MAYTRENLSCSVPIETAYYGSDFPLVCIKCGSPKKLREKEPEFYPQCKNCTGDRIQRRKRKVTEVSIIIIRIKILQKQECSKNHLEANSSFVYLRIIAKVISMCYFVYLSLGKSFTK